MNRHKKDPVDIRSLARSFAPMSVRELAGIVQNGTNDSARVAAANTILDRAYGKPDQTHEANIDLQITIRKLFADDNPNMLDVSPNATLNATPTSKVEKKD